MKAFTNANPRDLQHALTVVRQAKADGRSAALVGGGSDLLGMVKERIITPDVLVNLKAMNGRPFLVNRFQQIGFGLFDPRVSLDIIEFSLKLKTNPRLGKIKWIGE